MLTNQMYCKSDFLALVDDLREIVALVENEEGVEK